MATDIIEVTMDAVVITDLEGMITNAFVQHKDITDRKRAEEELEKHREHLEELVEERTAELRRSERQASAAIEAARAFTFSYDIASGKIDWGGAIEEITEGIKMEVVATHSRAYLTIVF